MRARRLVWPLALAASLAPPASLAAPAAAQSPGASAAGCDPHYVVANPRGLPTDHPFAARLPSLIRKAGITR